MPPFFVYLFFATFDGVKLVSLFGCLAHAFLPSAVSVPLKFIPSFNA